MININTLTADELRELIRQAQTELKSKETQLEYCTYSHDCQDCSQYHLGKYNHWAKLVESVDTAKSDGYAFTGDFLPVDRESRVLVGAVVVERCHNTVTAYQIDKDNKRQIDQCDARKMTRLILKVAEVLQKNELQKNEEEEGK